MTIKSGSNKPATAEFAGIFHLPADPRFTPSFLTTLLCAARLFEFTACVGLSGGDSSLALALRSSATLLSGPVRSYETLIQPNWERDSGGEASFIYYFSDRLDPEKTSRAE